MQVVTLTTIKEMKITKKALLIIALFMGFSLSSCGEASSTSNNTSTPQQTNQSQQTPQPATDW